MDELNPTVREQEIYEEMELTPESCRVQTTAWTLALSVRPGVVTIML